MVRFAERNTPPSWLSGSSCRNVSGPRFLVSGCESPSLLPYLATVATCFSGRDALVTDAVIIAVAGLFVSKERYGRKEASATVMNISVASVAVLCGWLATTVSNHLLIRPATVVTVLSFMTGYAVANYFCLLSIRLLLPRQSLPHKLATLEMKLLMLVFYVLTGVLTNGTRNRWAYRFRASYSCSDACS